MEENNGFVYCMGFNGDGGADEVVDDRNDVWARNPETIWFHLDYTEDEARQWLTEKSGLSELAVQMLISDDTRPRITASDGGLVICFRAVNFDPGSDPDDMVSLRLWINENRILSMRRRRVEAIRDVHDALEDGSGPEDSGSFLVQLCNSLTGRIAGVVDDIEEGVDALENDILSMEQSDLRTQTLTYRRMIIGLRKYVIPQRETLSRLQSERAAWLSDISRLHLRESAERMTRCIDDLDAARDRAAMAQEEISARLSEQMNRTIFMMSIVATIFLPLSLLTGLLGINVGGVPGADFRWAFLIVCGVLVVIAVALYFVFKRKQIL